MSTMQRLTMIGLYKYDSTLFDSLELPSGYDKQTFIDSLLLEHGEKLVLYSNPDFMKYSIGAWGRKWNLELKRIYEALTAEYDPIYNYDRFEEYTDTEAKTGSGSDSKNTNGSNDTTSSGTSNSTTSTNTTQSGTNEGQVSAYNSDSYSPENKEITSGNSQSSGTDGNITSGTSKVTTAETESGSYTNKDDRTFQHTAHLYGNIGVTTSAQMVTEVVKQRFEYNLYETATRLFANELLIGIY